jgi:hypothetical protein
MNCNTGGAGACDSPAPPRMRRRCAPGNLHRFRLQEQQSAATPHRAREGGLAHPADTSRSNLAYALGSAFEVEGFFHLHPSYEHPLLIHRSLLCPSQWTHAMGLSGRCATQYRAHYQRKILFKFGVSTSIRVPRSSYVVCDPPRLTHIGLDSLPLKSPNATRRMTSTVARGGAVLGAIVVCAHTVNRTGGFVGSLVY